MTWKAENAISETLYFMNFQGTMPLDPPPPPPKQPAPLVLVIVPPPPNKSNLLRQCLPWLNLHYRVRLSIPWQIQEFLIPAIWEG